MRQKQTLECSRPITGKRIRLQRLEPSHADFLLDCYKNDEFWATYRINQKRSIPRDQLIRQLDFEQQQLPVQVGKIEWLIFSLCSANNEQSTPIGLASLSAYDSKKSRAEFLIGLFRKEQRKPGLGLEVSLLVLDYAFNRELLKELVSFVYPGNNYAQRSTLALGFEHKGMISASSLSKSSVDDGFIYVNSMQEYSFRSNARLKRLSERILGFDITDCECKSTLANSKKIDLNTSFQIS